MHIYIVSSDSFWLLKKLQTASSSIWGIRTNTNIFLEISGRTFLPILSKNLHFERVVIFVSLIRYIETINCINKKFVALFLHLTCRCHIWYERHLCLEDIATSLIITFIYLPIMLENLRRVRIVSDLQQNWHSFSTILILDMVKLLVESSYKPFSTKRNFKI